MPKNWIWWKHGTIYHIYVRSFFDANGDGIGDLGGIIKKMGYLKKLGIDAIWLSPVFSSPNIDYGYDVTDFMQINPEYGFINEFKNLLDLAHRNGIRVILDMIMNHTSNNHPWFMESQESKENPKRDWYIWKNPDKGKVPNNWRNCFGGSAWEYHSKTKQFYYHSFFREQPDLNWRNTDLKNEFLKIFKFWLDMGVDGFRLDVVNFIIKDKKFRNNPGFLRRFTFGQKLYTRNRPRSLKILKEIRQLVDKYPEKMLVGEIYSLPPGNPVQAAKYLGNGKNMLHLTFDFSLIFQRWGARKYYLTLQSWYNAIPKKGWSCHVLSNHDLLRNYNRNRFRLFKKPKALVSAFFLLTIKGTPFIYYGDEIGMKNVFIPKRKMKDLLGIKYWPFFNGRDRARTPMQWNDEKNLGFSVSTPWLPIRKNVSKNTVSMQLKSKRSILWYYRKLISIRKKTKALNFGDFQWIHTGESGYLIYQRSIEKDKIWIILNFRFACIKLTNYNIKSQVLISTHRKSRSVIYLGQIKLLPFESTVVRVLK